MSSYLTSQRTRKVVTVSLTLSLALLALIFAASLQAGALALPARTVLLSTPVITQTYVIFGSGPSGNGISIDLTGSNGYGSELQVLGGGIYAGDGGHLQNLYVDGNPPPPIDIVGGCTGACEISGKAVINFNATPLPTPILYHITDFQPGGIYAIQVGSAYYHFTSSQIFTGVMDTGLYYVNGNVSLRNVTGTASIITTGDIVFSGNLSVTTYDSRFPLLFSESSNTSPGTIVSYNSSLDLTGDLYAPNGRINLSGVEGTLHGRAYAKEVELSAASMTVTCPACDPSWLTLSLQKSVTPTMDVPYHGAVTYTSILRNHDLVSSTSALFTDTLPAGVTFGQWIEQPISGIIQTGNTITWTGEISASTGITFTFTTTHTGGFGDMITNTAYFSGAAHTGSDEATFTVTSVYYTLTRATAGNGSGLIIAEPSGPFYPEGAMVTLTAVPNITSRFSSWSGDVITTVNPVTLTMDVNKSVTATFMLNTFTITPTASTNGSITPATPQTVNYGASQTFTITANTDYHIAAVGVDGISQGPISLYTFDNITTHHTITATFAINTYTLTLNEAGNGIGSVISEPPGPSYTAGTVVTLTAIMSPTSRFMGWSGDVISTTNPLVVTMDSDKAITATFVTYRVYLPLILR